MPRIEVDLPEQVYLEVIERALPVSQLLQDAVVGEVRRQELENAADLYVAELVAEVGQPLETALARADEVVERLRGRVVAT